MKRHEPSERETDILCARVYLAQARHWRNHPQQQSGYFLMLKWAANARRRAAAYVPAQGRLL